MAKMSEFQVIPELNEYTVKDSFFKLSKDSTIGVSSKEIIEKGLLLKSYLTVATAFELPVSVNSKSHIYIELTHSISKEDFPNESYDLEINTNQCLLKSNTNEGLCRGIQTIRQLFPTEIFSQNPLEEMEWTIRAATIKDKPHFKWRGMHLDVGRNFTGTEEVKRFIDLIALYKFNVFHWHLTEDQGWRIEIKKYPKLTSIGSKREETLIGHALDKPKKYDGKNHGGYYTQKEVKEIVEYASQREILIVPEIDMPGHMQAAISAYPQLGCTNGQLKPLCHWGVSQHILNVEESTINFMKDILDEVIDLFPGKYIHIGGDEAPKYEWEEEKLIQKRMIELNIKDENELQSWFIQQMANHIQSKGKKIIGWDEILEGGLAEGAVVMSWRGEKGGIKAAAMGHPVIMTPEDYVYFDHYQDIKEKEPLAFGGLTTLKMVYDYQIIPNEMPESDKHGVLGSQGQIWTEYMKNFKQIEYMMFPRTCALAENLWTKPTKKEYNSFLKKWNSHKKRLGHLSINFWEKKD